MKRLSLILSLLLATATFLPVTAMAKERLAFSGGPEGGTFQYFSNGIATRLSKNMGDVEVSNMASAGSVENLRRVDSGDADFGISYSGDLFLARNGKLPKDEKKYVNVQSLSYLYGAPAHLVVLADSGINKVSDLAGKKVGVGGAGSGAAASAQRYFETLGLWTKMEPTFIGYNEAVAAMGDKLLDAVWVFAGFPNSSVIQAAASNKIKLLDTVEAGKAGGFFDVYPFYAELTIPAGTYSGVDTPTKTFQDSALWVAGKHVKTDMVFNALKDIFSEEGLAYMVKVKKTAKEMSVADGLKGIVTPIHEGAEKFWAGKGLTVTAAQKAR
jgi:TRAP transporter TAXI family solute receptor